MIIISLLKSPLRQMTERSTVEYLLDRRYQTVLLESLRHAIIERRNRGILKVIPRLSLVQLNAVTNYHHIENKQYSVCLFLNKNFYTYTCPYFLFVLHSVRNYFKLMKK
jgi:hypothetical protein